MRVYVQVFNLTVVLFPFLAFMNVGMYVSLIFFVCLLCLFLFSLFVCLFVLFVFFFPHDVLFLAIVCASVLLCNNTVHMDQFLANLSTMTSCIM